MAARSPEVVTTLTLRRVLPVALFLMIFILAIRQSVSLDPDLWWHLKAGEQIATSHHVPHTDDFSFTKQGSEWVAHEWLSELLIYGIFKLTGLVGLVIAFSLLIVIVLWTIYRRCDGQPYVACVAILLAAAASSPLFGIRPQMITLLMASIFVTLLEQSDDPDQERPLWLLVPLMLVWVNLHAGFALGLALIFLYIVSNILDGQWHRLRSIVLVLLACTAVVPINPNGFRMFTYPYETLTSSSMATFIEEWASPDFHKLTYLPLAVLLLATLGAFAVSPRRARMGELFLILITAFGALRSVRHIPIFALFAAPALARHVWSFASAKGWDRWFTGIESRPTLVLLLVNLLLLIAPMALATSRIWHFSKYEKSYEGIRNPVAAVDFIQQHHLSGPIYNQYGWGGYLIYRLYPGYRVYIDGRADVYGDSFFAETMGVYDGKGKWRDVLDKHAVNAILISPDAPLAALVSADSNWKKIFEDDQSIILVRSTSRRTA